VNDAAAGASVGPRFLISDLCDLLESYLDIFMPAACFRLPGFIQDAGGRIRYMTTPGDIDDHGHYTQFVFRVECS